MQVNLQQPKPLYHLWNNLLIVILGRQGTRNKFPAFFFVTTSYNVKGTCNPGLQITIKKHGMKLQSIFLEILWGAEISKHEWPKNIKHFMVF